MDDTYCISLDKHLGPHLKFLLKGEALDDWMRVLNWLGELFWFFCSWILKSYKEIGNRNKFPCYSYYLRKLGRRGGHLFHIAALGGGHLFGEGHLLGHGHLFEEMQYLFPHTYKKIKCVSMWDHLLLSNCTK